MKPEKLYTIYNKYSNTVVYKYKGHTYEVEYATSFNYCVPSARVQHQLAQEKIDRIVNQNDNKSIISADEALDDWFKFMEG